MRRCLIGYTGLVGSNLAEQMDFDAVFNSKNIEEIRGQYFDEIYCAGIYSLKWWANKYPDEDWENISSLLALLGEVRADRFVLFSTVDVYPTPILGTTEQAETSLDSLHAYGRHRLLIEHFVQERFPAHHCIRFPNLYGNRLKKNALYDLMWDNEVEKIHSEMELQFYDLRTLARDVGIVVENGLKIVNFATEPVTMREMAKKALGVEFVNQPHDDPFKYDMHSLHAEAFGSKAPYLQWKDEVLDRIADFVRQERKNG